MRSLRKPTLVVYSAVYAYLTFFHFDLAGAFQEASLNTFEVDRKQQAASLVEACLLNITSLERGDALIRISRVGDSFAEIGPQELSLYTSTAEHHRIVFDFPNDRFFYAAVIEAEQLVFNDPESKEDFEKTSQKTVKGFLVDGENRFSFMLPSDVRKISQAVKPLQVVRDFKMPDIRMFGVTPFGAGDFSATVDALSFYSTGDNVLSERDLGKGISKVTFQFTSPSINMKTEYVIDVNKMVPLEIIQSFIEDGTNEKPWSKEILEWQEINGSMIAKTVRRDARVGSRINRKPHIHPYDEKADIHCFSANEPLDDRLFDPDNIKELEKLLKMCDPETSGATSLLEAK